MTMFVIITLFASAIYLLAFALVLKVNDGGLWAMLTFKLIPFALGICALIAALSVSGLVVLAEA